MCAAFCTLAPLSDAAETPAMSYQSALKAFEDGDAANALIQAKVSGSTGDKDAQTLVGHILLSGKVGTPDPAEAMKWFQKAAIQGQAEAMVELGKLGIANEGGLSNVDALNWLTRAAKQGRSDAMRALSGMYIHGKGTPPNPKKGRDWLLSAADQGDVLAYRQLGDLDFEANPKSALAWYEKAAALGESESAYIAGVMYAENFEIKPDVQKSAQLLGRAAMAGHPAAQADYGLLVYQGNGVARSIDAAADWFKKSAKNGDPEGRFLYAFTLAKGEGVPQSFEEAYYWLLRADEDTGLSGIDAYDRDRAELKKRLEDNVEPDILARARKRAFSDKIRSVQ